MQKVDFKKQLKHLYAASARQVEMVDVPQLNFLMVDGTGDPNTSPAFSAAIEALYPLAFTLKFMAKREEVGVDYTVMPLEALWWADDMRVFSTRDKDAWQWTLMIMQPDFISAEMFTAAGQEVTRKKNPAALPLVRFEPFREGRAAQTLHIGPFDAEGPTIRKVHDFIAAGGHKRSGRHHEIYLSDLRRGAPEKWRTIIRQPLA